MKHFFSKHKKLLTCLLLLVTAGIILGVNPVYAAEVEKYAALMLAAIMSSFIWFAGRLITVIIYILIWVATYNDFINSDAVDAGWTIVRDICNMAFILVLLLIAFATTLNRPSYHMKLLLPKLVLAAVAINFSKLICGVIIDFAQVAMLTFVNGFRDIGAGNFASMFGLSELLQLKPESVDGVTALSIVGSYFLASIYLIVAIVVVIIILFILIMRMVMLWILIVLSPIPYLLKAIPGQEGNAKKWWDKFIENVIAGPILAFFIWLSFAAISVPSTGQSILGEDTKPPILSETESTQYVGSISEDSKKLGEPAAGMTKVATPDTMLKFLISIGLLMGGLMVTKSVGGSAAGAIIGKGEAALKGMRKWGQKQAVIGGKNVAGFGLRKGGQMTQFAGNALSRATGGKLGDTLQKTGKFAASWGGDIKKTRTEAKEKKRKETLEKLGMKDETMGHLSDAAKTTGGRMVKGLGVAAVGAAMGGMPMVVAGLAHAIAARDKNWVGGAFKSFAGYVQRTSTESKAKGKLDTLKQGMSDAYVNKEDKIANYRKNEAEEVTNLRAQQAHDVNMAQVAGKPQDEIDRINEAFENKYESITDRYRKLADKAEENYQTTTSDKDLRSDQVLAPQVQQAQREYNAAKSVTGAGKTRKDKIEASNEEYSQREGKLKQRKEAALEDVRKNYTGLAQEQGIARVNATYKQYQDTLKTRKKQDQDKIHSDYAASRNVPIDNAFAKAFNWTGDKMKGWEPNNLTIKGAKLGMKEVTDAKNMVYSLGTKSFTAFDKNAFAGGSGLNGKQKKVFSQMAGSSDDAKAARQNVISEIRRLRASGDASSKRKVGEVIENFKEGLAHHLKDKPETKSAYSEVISELEQTDTNHPKGFKKIEEFGDKY